MPNYLSLGGSLEVGEAGPTTMRSVVTHGAALRSLRADATTHSGSPAAPASSDPTLA